LRGQRALVRIQPGVSRGRSSSGQSTGAPLRRGPFEPGRPLSLTPSKAPGVTESTASSNLAGPGSTPGGPAHFTATPRRGPERLGYLMDRGLPREPRGSKPRPDRTPRPRHRLCCGPKGSGYRLRIDRSRVRIPPGASRAPVAQWVEQFRASNTTAAASSIHPRAGLERLSGRAPG
jgi:hypothetical protein